MDQDSLETATAPAKPRSSADLLPSEKHFLAAMREVGFGRFEKFRIQGGQIVLDPWPTAIREVKFAAEVGAERAVDPEFQLKRHVAEFFEYVRAVNAGEIRALEIRHGLPFSMQIEISSARDRGGRS